MLQFFFFKKETKQKRITENNNFYIYDGAVFQCSNYNFNISTTKSKKVVVSVAIFLIHF